jgi:hypothetical protein
LEQFLEVPGAADLNIKDKNGDIALGFAARLDNTDICQYLLKIVLIVSMTIKTNMVRQH